MFAAFVYILNVVICNVLFSYVPMVDLGTFGMLSPVAFLVGFTFVFRDYAQRSIGHLVLPCMGVACIISYVMADPFVAVASAISFAVAEFADYALYTWTKRPFHKRVLLSSVVSTPVDTVVFLWFINALDPATVVVMIITKLLAALVIYGHYERKQAAQSATV